MAYEGSRRRRISDSFSNYTPVWKKRIVNLVSEPKILGYFSVDGDRNYLPDSSKLMYYKPPTSNEVDFDLNKGIEKAIHKASDEDGRISHLLQWIQLNHAKIQRPGSNSWIEPKFACSCGLLATVMCSPFKPKFGWIVCAAKWKGTIYMCRFQTPEEKISQKRANKKYESWGFKFEQYMVSDAPDKEPDTSKPVVEPAEFRCIFQRRFGQHSVLFTAEMDGLYSKKALKDPLPLNDLRFVELKTHGCIKSEWHRQEFRRHKLLRWWAQSFLVDNELILCGFRDDTGVVKKLENYKLPQIIDMSKKYWNPVSCVNECQEFLNRVSKTVVDDCDKTIYKFERKPYDDVFMEELSPESEYAFMPPSFLTATR